MALSIGFIGVGTIASAMVEGLAAGHGGRAQIHLSPRGADAARALAARLPGVQVESSAQQVVDRSQWVCLTVPPAAGQAALEPLNFGPEHRVVSLLAGTPLARLKGWVGPCRSLHRMVALPFCRHGVGPVAVTPMTAELEAIFAPLGRLIPAAGEDDLNIYSAITALMSPFYAVLGGAADWGARQGLPAGAAADYTRAFFQAMPVRAEALSPQELSVLWREMTPGGINQLAWETIAAGGGFELWQQALDAALARNRAATARAPEAEG